MVDDIAVQTEEGPTEIFFTVSNSKSLVLFLAEQADLNVEDKKVKHDGFPLLAFREDPKFLGPFLEELGCRSIRAVLVNPSKN